MKGNNKILKSLKIIRETAIKQLGHSQVIFLTPTSCPYIRYRSNNCFCSCVES